MAQHKLVVKNHGGKLPVSIKYQNLYSFKEGMIHLCQSILKTRPISHLHGSALFTIPVKVNCSLSVNSTVNSTVDLCLGNYQEIIGILWSKQLKDSF